MACRVPRGAAGAVGVAARGARRGAVLAARVRRQRARAPVPPAVPRRGGRAPRRARLAGCAHQGRACRQGHRKVRSYVPHKSFNVKYNYFISITLDVTKTSSSSARFAIITDLHRSVFYTSN